MNLTFTDKDWGQVSVDMGRINKVIFDRRERCGIVVVCKGYQYVPSQHNEIEYIINNLLLHNIPYEKTF